jgi:hypothetical protein
MFEPSPFLKQPHPPPPESAESAAPFLLGLFLGPGFEQSKKKRGGGTTKEKEVGSLVFFRIAFTKISPFYAVFEENDL